MPFFHIQLVGNAMGLYPSCSHCQCPFFIYYLWVMGPCPSCSHCQCPFFIYYLWVMVLCLSCSQCPFFIYNLQVKQYVSALLVTITNVLISYTSCGLSLRALSYLKPLSMPLFGILLAGNVIGLRPFIMSLFHILLTHNV